MPPTNTANTLLSISADATQLAALRLQGKAAAKKNETYREALSTASFGSLAQTYLDSAGTDQLVLKELRQRSDFSDITFSELVSTFSVTTLAMQSGAPLREKWSAILVQIPASANRAGQDEVVDALGYFLGREPGDDFTWPEEAIRARSDGAEILTRLKEEYSKSAVQNFVQQLWPKL